MADRAREDATEVPMTVFQTTAVLLVLAAAFSYVNHRFLRLPTAIGLMGLALASSVALLAAGAAGFRFAADAVAVVSAIDFDEALMHGMLGLLLFAGALHVDLTELREQRGLVLGLATVGVLVSTVVIGVGLWGVGQLGVGGPLSLLDCLVFGALVSPTDPIAVLGVMKTVGVPRAIEVTVTGESLLNDGVGVVVFVAVVGLAYGSGHGGGFDPVDLVGLLVREAGGGALFGLATGWVTFRLLRSIDDYKVEVLLTLALVVGGYALAEALHVSAAIAAVAAGLLIGNRGREEAMSDLTRRHLDAFWELIDEMLNAVLFLLMGLQILVLDVGPSHVLLAIAAIGVVLAGRFVSVAIPVTLVRRFRPVAPYMIRVLTWGGLRGGISIALALSLPLGPSRDTLLATTYGVVVFSILVQGLTIAPALRRLGLKAEGPPGPGHLG
jgi:CPA1 family monovalent cation:H+ antiporter